MKSRPKLTLHVRNGVVEIAVLAVAVGLLYAALVAVPTYYLWNWLMPAIFGLQPVTFWQALGLNILAWLVFHGRPSIELRCEVSEGGAGDKEELSVAPSR